HRTARVFVGGDVRAPALAPAQEVDAEPDEQRARGSFYERLRLLRHLDTRGDPQTGDREDREAVSHSPRPRDTHHCPRAPPPRPADPNRGGGARRARRETRDRGEVIGLEGGAQPHREAEQQPGDHGGEPPASSKSSSSQSYHAARPSPVCADTGNTRSFGF